MNNLFTDSFWKAVSETAAKKGLIEAAVVVYTHVYGMNITECCSAVGLGAKHVKEILSDFDGYSATLIPVSHTDRMSA
jgi:hypothetical protein